MTAATLFALVTAVAVGADAESRWAAGDDAGAVAALRAGLLQRPADGDLHAALAVVRDSVGYPPGVRPPPLEALQHRVSNARLLLASVASAALLVLGRVASLFGRRTPRLVLTALAGLGWAAVLVVVAVRAAERFESARRPPLVVSETAVLRGGNGHAFPPRLDAALPPGVECVELHRRGGWVQVGLAGPTPEGVAGWLPEGAVIAVAPPLTMAP